MSVGSTLIVQGVRIGTAKRSGFRTKKLSYVRAQDYFPVKPPVEPKLETKPKAKVLVSVPRPGYEIIVVGGKNVEIPIGCRCGLVPDNERVKD